MAFSILNIGADLGVGALRGLPLMLGGLHDFKQGLPFPALLQRGLDLLAEDDPAISQIASLLASGTPISTIAERIAQNVTTSLVQSSGLAPSQDARSTLQRALASALAPPGKSPPTTPQQAYQLAATLETQLAQLLTTLSSAPPTAGQKNEISGQLLDAKPAKEPPAPQQSIAIAAEQPAQIAAFARALLLQAATPLPSSAPAPAARAIAPVPPAPTRPAASAPLAQADILTRILTRAGAAQSSPVAAPTETPTPTPAPANDAIPAPLVDVAAARAAIATPAVPVQARAAAVVAQVPAPQSAAVSPNKPAQSSPGNANAASAEKASSVFDRLTAVITQHYSAGEDGASGRQPQQQQSLPLPAQQPAQPPQTLPQNAVAAQFISHLPAAAASPVASASPAHSYATVDPQAIIDQVVKGIVVSSSGAQSQIRLQLSPAHLGDVAMRLTVTGNSVSATMVAQNASVRDVLLANQQQLSRSLSDAGLSLSNFSVDVSGGNAGFAQQQSPRNAAIHRRIIGTVEASTDLENTDPLFGPPLLGGGRSLVLNYLA